MATTVIDVYSKAFPSITNRIRAAIFLETDLLAPVATIIDITAGHPTRIYHFPGLPRANYAFSLDEIDGGGVPINNLALFDVVPPSLGSISVRDDEQIKVGVTTGFNAGLTTVTFDGTAGKPNYVGWNIVPSELTLRGILALGLDYSWNSITGVFSLLQPGDTLQANTYYNIHFDPIIELSGAGGSIPTVNDFSTRIVTATGNIDISDFGANVIAEVAGLYAELTLPDITTVVQGRPMRFEMASVVGNAVKCVKFLTIGADVIRWLRGNIYAVSGESLEIYRFRRPDLSNEWRVRCADGNFKRVGESVSDDFIQSGIICKQLLDGSIKDKTQYARIYNEVVLNLPGTQVVNFDSWSTGNNKYLFSLANSADPGNANKFHFPDRRNLFERNNNAGKAGDFGDQSIGSHKHKIWGQDNLASPSGAASNEVGNVENAPIPEVATAPAYFSRSSGDVIGGTGETLPKHYLINKYVLI